MTTIKRFLTLFLLITLSLSYTYATDDVSTITSKAWAGLSSHWSASGDAFGYDGTRGAQLNGTARTLTATDFTNVTSVSISCSKASSATGTITITAGSNTKSITSFSTSPTSETLSIATPYTGTITISISPSNKSLYIKSITVTYSGGGGTTYTVTYDANGGTGTMTDSNSPYSSGATVTTLANTFTRDGYTFTGWNTAANGSGASYAAGATFTISANTTLFAQWTSSGGGSGDTYTLVTDASSLAVDDEIIILDKNGTYALSTTQNSNNRAGTTSGWSLDGTVVTVTGDDVQILTLTAETGSTWGLYTGSGYLYAAASGSNHMKTQTTNNEDGYWTITIDGTTKVASISAEGSSNRHVMQYNGDNHIFSCYSSASQTGLKIYKKDVGTKYDITWNNGGHGTAPTSPTSAAKLDLPTLTADGYTNTGWKASKIVVVNGSNVAANTLIPCGTNITLTANTILTAQWEVETYTITLTKSSYDCATDGSITIQYNATEPTSFTPATRTGYIVSNGITATDVFGGYCNGPSGGSRIFNPDGTFASDNVSGFITNGKWTNTSKTLVLHPRWEENCSNKVNVSVNVSGGHGTATANKTPVSTCSCTNGDRLVKITATPETGYVVENITWATTSGTVAATKQDGNSGKTIWSFYFAQDNSGAGTFTVTFVEQKKYHITFINNLHGGSTSTSAECDENVSTSITFPSISDATESTGTTCEEEHFHFVGWVKNGQAVTDANIKKAGSNTVKLTSNETYYAVWAKKVTGTGNTYKILTSSDDITTGDYVIAAYNSATSYYVLSNVTSTYNMSGSATIAVSSGTITNPTSAQTWAITKTGTKITIKNKSNNKYLYIYTSGAHKNLGMQNTSANFTYSKGTGTNPSWKLYSETVSGYLIEWYGDEFKPYTDENSSNKIYLFRREDSYGDYITSCAPPTTWSVVYDANGKTLSPGVSLPAAVTDLEENVDFTVPANNYVSSPDYAQIGWNTDATATTGLTTIPGQTAGTIITLYAIWQKSQVEVVEVTGTNDIIIEHNFGGNTGAELDKWATVIKGSTAKDIFFSKYFEAAFNVKLIAIFNGTGGDKDVSDLRIDIPWYNTNTSLMPSGNYHRYINIGTVLTNASRSTTLKNGEEVILYSYQPTAKSGSCYRDQDILDAAAEQGVDMSNWIAITYDYEATSGGNGAICFSGKEPILLERKVGSTWAPIDVIGAADASLNAIYPTTKPSWGDAEGWICSGGKNLKDTTGATIQLSTNRCLLVRKFSVLDGSKAVSSNIGSGATFTTLCDEWYGYHVDYSSSTSNCYQTDNQNSADGFGYVGAYDYNSSYEKYTTVEPDEFTATNNTDGTMTIHIDPDKVAGGLASLSCDMLKIKVTDNTTGDVLGQVEYKVPIIVAASGTETNNEIFTKFDDCSTCDVVILQDATLAPNASGKNTIRDLEVYRGAKLNVPSDKTLTVNNLIMRSKGDVTPQADIQGTLNRKDTKLYFDKRVDENQWYWIALPYDCNMADVTFRNGDKPTYGVGKDWVLKTYNGVKRANTQAGGCWETVPENSTLKAGVGYILGVTPKTGHTYAEIRFPMTAEDWDKDRATVTVPVTPTASENITPNHVGWNLVGNPYLTNYAPGYVGMDNADNSNNLIPLGLLQENAENEYERVGSTRYVVIPQNGGYSEYRQVAIGDQKLPTFMSYFIQIDGSVGTNYKVDFKYANSHYAASPMRRAPEEYMEEPEDNHPVWVPVTLANGKGEKDETTFLISNQFTDKYDMMDDLIKWRGDYYQYPSVTTKPVLASRNSEAELAFNALPDNSAWNGIPLNYFATNAGMYTIELSDKYGLDEVAEAVLYDAETQVRHDLKSESYTFSSARTDNTDRFTLYLRVERKKAPEVATDVDNLQAGDKPQKVLVNGNVYILRGGKVFDITGKQVR